MASEQQFYEAKVYLKAYNDALRTLDQITGQEAQLQKNKSYAKLLQESSNAGAVRINGETLEKGKNFETSSIRKLGNFSKDFFRNKLSGFQSAKDPIQLSQIFEKFLNA